MLRFNRLTVALTVAIVVLLGHPDTAHAQSLTFSPSSVGLTISGPGGVAGPTSVSVSSATPISSLFISGINTSDHTNWLCATASGNTVNVYAGTGSCSFTPTTTQLALNQNYTVTVNVQGNGGTLVGSISVTLSVGNSGGGGGGSVVASPSSISFNATPGGQVPAQQVQVIQSLLIGNETHDACQFPFSKISSIPSLRMITIP